ncbi:DNA methyltransferase [Ekhidna sp.]|uniref:DNA methyltransferase n=1 Tax=Ekhidna sp. TaxID=2608089 RepID=UPI003C7A2A6B
MIQLLLEEMIISKEIKEASKLTKEEWKEYTKTVWHIANTSHAIHPAIFPEEIPKRLIKLFSFVEETILDPFGGVGTTSFVSSELNRKSIYIDQNGDYLNIAKNRLEESKVDLVSHILKHGDSRDMSFIDSNNVDLIITSPPYWDKADYGGNGSNIGSIDNYNKFFEEIRPVFDECFRVLRPGRKLCLVTANVNQNTNHGLLTFPLSTDFANLLREIGFVMINEVIWSKDKTGGKWGSYGAQRPIFGSYPYPPNFLFKNVHEYVLIFAKPNAKAKKGGSVKNYEGLMNLPESLHSKIFED